MTKINEFVTSYLNFEVTWLLNINVNFCKITLSQHKKTARKYKLRDNTKNKKRESKT